MFDLSGIKPLSCFCNSLKGVSNLEIAVYGEYEEGFFDFDGSIYVEKRLGTNNRMIMSDNSAFFSNSINPMGTFG
jgi:hypothetical protein